MCRHGQTVEVMVRPYGAACFIRQVDRCLAPLVQALNDAGVPTVASCCGHGQQPGSLALADGRHLVILPTLEEGNRVIGLLRYHERGPFAPVEVEQDSVRISVERHYPDVRGGRVRLEGRR